MRKDCWIQGDGPLVPFAEAFRDELEEAGHPTGSVKHYLLLMRGLNRWLHAEGIGVEGLTSGVAQEFLESKRDAGQRRVPTLAMLGPLFSWLESPPARPLPARSCGRSCARQLPGLLVPRYVRRCGCRRAGFRVREPAAEGGKAVTSTVAGYDGRAVA